MSFNQYSIYAIVSNIENGASEKLENVIKIIDEIKDFSNLQDAQKYINENFNVDDNLQQKYINESCMLKIIKKVDYTTFIFDLPQKQISYSFLNDSTEEKSWV